LPDGIKALLCELRVGLEGSYGDRLRGVYLYGSYARDDEDDESDVDVLIVLDQCDHYGAEVDWTGSLVSDLSLKYGVSISRVFVSHRDWLGRDSPFGTNA
jgi:uncharacterized protein